MKSVSFVNDKPVDFQTGLQDVQKKKALSQALMQQAFQPWQPKVVSGRVINTGLADSALKMAQAFFANKAENDAKENERKLVEGRRKQVADALTTYGPTLYDPKSTPEQVQAASAAMASSLDPEDLSKIAVDTYKQALDPRERMARKVASVQQEADKTWRTMPAAGVAPDQEGDLVQTAATPDSESPEYYQHLATVFDKAGLPQESEKARKEAEKRARDDAKEKQKARSANWQITSALADNYRQDSKDFALITGHYARVKQSAKNPSPAGDVSLIFAFMKMLDPTSVVREGEYATAQNAGSIPESLIGMYNKALNGQRLAPSIRDDFVTRSKMLYESAARQQAKIDEQYTATGKRWGVNPSDFIVRRSTGDEEVGQIPAKPQQPQAKPPLTSFEGKK